MEETKALNALEPFLALTKSATSPRAAADLITRATSAPNTYLFTELLQAPQIQALAGTEFAPYLTLLDIFSHGTYSTYLSTPNLPELNDAQRLKLCQLSLLTLAKTSSPGHDAPGLDYPTLQKALDLPTREALEELVIGAIYAGLLNAQLDPKAARVRVNSVAPLRDVAPSAIGGLLSSLQAWAGRCEETLRSLSCQMTQLRADADRRAARAAERVKETARLMEEEKKGGKQPSLSRQSSSNIATFGGGGGGPAAAASLRGSGGIAAAQQQRHLSLLGPHQTTSSSTSTNSNTIITTTTNETSNMLMVGVGSSSLPHVDSNSNNDITDAASAGTTDLQVTSNANQVGGGATGGGGLDNEAEVDMEVDPEDPATGATTTTSRPNKRKLDNP
ncbi:hypothetical protein VTJ04DRAFT_1574 [Mycothermus thermophilus]|uniref:uncharacterized protein n=1 Tax=Humicola insolens TaxID=85995 RepID=UPI003744871C